MGAGLLEDTGEVRAIRLQQIRDQINPDRYRRSPARALLWYLVDGTLYLCAVAGALFLPSWWAQLLAGLVTGSAVAFMFVWAHDAAHGALFSSQRTARTLGTPFMLPSFNMYRLWALGHNRVHHGFTSLTSVDWIWRPWSPSEYHQKSVWQKMLYRLERTPYTCALHYLLRVWWPGMVAYRGDARNRKEFLVDKLVTLAFFLGFSISALLLSGWWGWISAVLLPFIVFNYYIALFVFLHHTHPEVPFYTEKNEWSPSLGQLYCSTTVRCSRITEMMIHNILIHTPHHVDPRIPFYHLRDAYDDLQKHYGPYIHEMRFSFRAVRNVFLQCQLYDYEHHRWIRFRSVRQWLQEQAAEIAAGGRTAAPGTVTGSGH